MPTNGVVGLAGTFNGSYLDAGAFTLGDTFTPPWQALWISIGLTFLLLVSGAYYFRSTEKTFADVV